MSMEFEINEDEVAKCLHGWDRVVCLAGLSKITKSLNETPIFMAYHQACEAAFKTEDKLRKDFFENQILADIPEDILRAAAEEHERIVDAGKEAAYDEMSYQLATLGHLKEEDISMDLLLLARFREWQLREQVKIVPQPTRIRL